MKWVQVPAVEPGPDGRTWRIVRAGRYDCGLGLVDLPVGSTTDFASVPRWAWGFAAPASGRHRLAALIHDRLYQTRQTPRAVADAIFRAEMRRARVPAWRAWLMGAAVGLVGAAAFRGGGRD